MCNGEAEVEAEGLTYYCDDNAISCQTSLASDEWTNSSLIFLERVAYVDDWHDNSMSDEEWHDNSMSDEARILNHVGEVAS